MLVSYKWLNEYFGGKLPDPVNLADVITMNSFEVESAEKNGDDTVIDVKILPNRAHDCLCHRGVAREIGVLLGMIPEFPAPKAYQTSVPATIKVKIEHEHGRRYVGRRISGIKIGPSPEWLKLKLEALGQRSINNVVDITNFCMFELGQPMHAFDATKVRGAITVRMSRAGERITTLDGREIELGDSTLIIADSEKPLAIAGVKGGTAAEVGAGTTAIILESANFHPGDVRKTSTRLGIKTDASKRFENEITPELARDATELATALIVEFAAGPDIAIEESVDAYPRPRRPYKMGVSTEEANRILGVSLSDSDVEAILDRTGWKWEKVEPRTTIVARAKELISRPYKLGASVSYDAPESFDCSSFASYLYSQAGLSLPRISVDQFVYGEPIELVDLKPGDLVFSNSGNGAIHYETKEWLKGAKVPEGVDHVGVWLGEGKIIHASRHNGSGSVDIEKLADAKAFKTVVGARRILGVDEKRYVVTVPAERLDLRIKEDLIEEVGRIHGYDKIPTAPPLPAVKKPVANKNLNYARKIRRALVYLGFSEVFTYVFQDEGSVEIANPLASDKGFLRGGLKRGVRQSLDFNARYADLLGLDEIRVFEIGKVFSKDGEWTALCIGAEIVKNAKKNGEAAIAVLESARAALSESLGIEIKADIIDGMFEIDIGALIDKLPASSEDGVLQSTASVKFKSLSPFPFVLRDIAVWVPEKTKEAVILGVITAESGELLVRTRLFDVFSKKIDGVKKISYAFRLVFQSYEKTLTDDEVNVIMEKITKKLGENEGWEVR